MAPSRHVILAACISFAGCAKGSSPRSTAPVSVTVAPAPAPAAGGVQEAAGPPKLSTPATGSCALEAKLRAEDKRRDGPSFVLELTNRGSTPLRLVTPGDGSESGWRTPVVTWSATANGKPASATPLARCGLMNPIEKDEIFTLAPGASREIREWLPPLSLPAGTYAIRLTYRNDPSLVTSRDDANEEVRQLLARTSTCEVTTNAVEVTLQ